MGLNKRNQERRNYWQEQFESWEKSGIPQSEYCRQNNIDIHLFSKWKNKLLKIDEKKENKFVRIPQKKMINELSRASEIELAIRDQYKIKVANNFDPETLKKLVSTLKDMP
jgi:transketolase